MFFLKCCNFKLKFSRNIYFNLYDNIMSGASFSNGIRTFLYRVWDDTLPIIDILMYFPSTADENKDDITIKRIINIVKNNNYGGINVYNLNTIDELLLKITDRTKLIIAWGNKVTKKENDYIIHRLQEKYELYCFKKNNNGNPSLPTRLPNNIVLEKY